jgi:hypothetical protein
VGLIFNVRYRFFALLRTLGFSVVIALGVAIVLHAQDAGGPAAQGGGATTIRSGGVIEDSYYYHHLGPMRSAIEAGGIPQANGWYEYGFPMQSYRWGWFGAERHYPRVIWHDGYYGDSIRTAYRGY